MARQQLFALVQLLKTGETNIIPSNAKASDRRPVDVGMMGIVSILN